MKKSCIIFLLAAFGVSRLLAGVVYEIETTDHQQSPPKTETIQTAVEGRLLKVGIPSKGKGSQGSMIYRGDRREMLVVDPNNQSYLVMDEAAMKQLGGQVNAAMAQMQEALKNVPEDRRAMVEQMMKNRMPAQAPKRAPSELRKTAENAVQNGYPCVKYEVFQDGRKISEIWVTNWSNVESGDEVVAAFEDMAVFMRELLASLPDLGQQGNMGADNAFEHMKEMNGFPVITREFAANGTVKNESALRSAAKQTLTPADFEPPTGYKRQEMFKGR